MSALQSKSPVSAGRYLQGPNLPRAAHATKRATERRRVVGEMRRERAREEQERRNQDRFASTLVIEASIIAAVRLARDQDISRPSPRLVSVVTASIGLARMILEKIVR